MNQENKIFKSNLPQNYLTPNFEKLDPRVMTLEQKVISLCQNGYYILPNESSNFINFTLNRVFWILNKFKLIVEIPTPQIRHETNLILSNPEKEVIFESIEVKGHNQVANYESEDRFALPIYKKYV